jgi:hypothetical protein
VRLFLQRQKALPDHDCHCAQLRKHQVWLESMFVTMGSSCGEIGDRTSGHDLTLSARGA